MKIIRQSLWTKPQERPDMLMFLRETDLALPFEQTVEQLRQPQAGVFCGIATFDMPGNPEMVEVSLHGATNYYGHEAHRIERDQAMLYHYNGYYMRRCNDRGVVANTVPHPMTAEQIKVVFEQLVLHPEYKPTKTVHGFGTDFIMVTLHDGKVTVDAHPMGPR
jgi:hypothetical protein